MAASLIALILLLVDRSISITDKATQIGAGLAASFIFAVTYTVLANREYAELIRTEIASQLSGHLDDVLHNIRVLNQLFLPTGRYPAALDFDPHFNRDLMTDLSSSNSYFFRGTSAKFVPARLRAASHHLQAAQMILLDPRDESAIKARVADRQRRPSEAGKSLPELEDEIRGEILMALVALFDCRDQTARFSQESQIYQTGLLGRVVNLVGYSTFESSRHGIELSNVQLNFLVHVDNQGVKLNFSSHSAWSWIPLADPGNQLLDSFTRKIMLLAQPYCKHGRVSELSLD